MAPSHWRPTAVSRILWSIVCKLNVNSFFERERRASVRWARGSERNENVIGLRMFSSVAEPWLYGRFNRKFDACDSFSLNWLRATHVDAEWGTEQNSLCLWESNSFSSPLLARSREIALQPGTFFFREFAFCIYRHVHEIVALTVMAETNRKKPRERNERMGEEPKEIFYARPFVRHVLCSRLLPTTSIVGLAVLFRSSTQIWISTLKNC